MKRLNAIPGTPVVFIPEGRRIGNVERAFLHAGGKRLLGVLIKGNGIRQARTFAYLSDIDLIGDVSLLVKDTARAPKKEPEGPCEGTRVWSAEGDRLGWLSNALIEERTGRVHALEVTMGYIDDLTKGRIWVREFTVRPCGVIAVLRAPGTQPGDPFP